MPVLKQIYEGRKDYRRCVPADIGRHFDRMKEWITNGERNEFESLMLECIEAGTAWCNKNTFLYYLKENKRYAQGVAIFGMAHPMDMLSLFIGVFSFEDTDTAIMRFRLHPGKFIQEYKALLTVVSIKRTHRDPNHQLMIRVSEFRDKIFKMLKTGRDK